MKRLYLTAIALIGAAVVVPAGCTKQAALGTTQASFSTPEEAVTAMVAAVEKNNPKELLDLLGPGTESLLSSGDTVADRTAREAFLKRYRTQHQLVAGGADDLVLQVGEDGWPSPITLVRSNGRWRFDGAAGGDELLLRRIGSNELRTIDAMRGFVAAQEEYAAAEHDGVAAGVYAQRLHSEAGKHNGLYWEAAPGEPQSPAGPLLAAAAAEGYTGSQGTSAPYHGYIYRMLFSQGPAASTGAQNYLSDGGLTGGFALLAVPDSYGVSGVMSFIVNQDGIVWQRDLGEATAQLASSIQQFNPDSEWTPIAPDD